MLSSAARMAGQGFEFSYGHVSSPHLYSIQLWCEYAEDRRWSKDRIPKFASKNI